MSPETTNEARKPSSVSGADQVRSEVPRRVTAGPAAPAGGAVGAVLNTTCTDSARNAVAGSNTAHAELCAAAAEGCRNASSAAEFKMIQRMDTSLLSSPVVSRGLSGHADPG